MQTIFEYEKKGSKPQIDGCVLLSTSPRRRDLLAFLEPEILAVEVDERAVEERFMALYADDDFLTRAAKTCCEISKAKSDMTLEEGKVYISADTIVLSDELIFNKPLDLGEARDMLRSYFGKSHYVVTSVCLRAIDYLEVFYTLARVDFVDFYPRLEEAINRYVEEKRPLDKSGAYGIQELDPRFVKGIEGDVYTIVGLPVAEVSSRLFASS